MLVGRTEEGIERVGGAVVADAAAERRRHQPLGPAPRAGTGRTQRRSEEHTSELQSLMRISYAVFCLKKKNTTNTKHKSELLYLQTQTNPHTKCTHTSNE